MEAPAYNVEQHTLPRRRRRTDWRFGGTRVRKWNATVLLVALLCLGSGALASTVARLGVGDASGQPAGLLLFWFALAVATAFALSRGVPAGLFRFRLVDLLWGVGAGLFLRWLHGVSLATSSTPFPGFQGTDRRVPADWWWSNFLTSGFLGPIFEEFFFRVVVLVSIYEILRRAVGVLGAGATALLVSSGSFVLVHGLNAPVSLQEGIQLFAVGGLCATIVLLTGRLWGALLAHMVYNLLYLTLVIVGTSMS